MHLEDSAICGLRVRSDLALPELLPWIGEGRDVDLVIRLGDVPDRVTDAADTHPLIQVSADGGCRFALPDVAAFLVSPDGRAVTVAPARGTTEADIRVFLLGTVFAIICQRRGLLPLHACCVRVGPKAVAFAGDSGVGKSTLAAHLWARGHALLADDITVVDIGAPGGPMVLPSFPRLKLWRDALESLGRTIDRLGPIRPGLDKYQLPLDDGFCNTPLPLAALVRLDGNRKTPDGLRLLDAVQGLGELGKVLYRPRLMLRLGTQAQQMAQFLRLLSSIGGLRTLRRPETIAGWGEVEALLPVLAG
jgi:hypothetical protein